MVSNDEQVFFNVFPAQNKVPFHEKDNLFHNLRFASTGHFPGTTYYKERKTQCQDFYIFLNMIHYQCAFISHFSGGVSRRKWEASAQLC